jgi:hypothetical protein
MAANYDMWYSINIARFSCFASACHEFGEYSRSYPQRGVPWSRIFRNAGDVLYDKRWRIARRPLLKNLLVVASQSV